MGWFCQFGKLSVAATVSLLLVLVVGCAQEASKRSELVTAIGDDTPWTQKDFLNKPEEFQFVVIGDRTGGHRPEVFTKAMQQINWLQPEFVVCVGDLIEGYTEDEAELNRQWQHIEDSVDQLDMPFFYTVGNHDISNPAMQDLWRQRLGRDYYSFIYKDVLFLSLNTEDPPIQLPPESIAGQQQLVKMMQNDPEATQRRLLEHSRQQKSKKPLPGTVAISQQQLDFVKATLKQHEQVRWTILLMHKPAWQEHYASEEFAQIETLLQDRDYTVIAGHEHYYMYSNRFGRDYVDMGTTGGVQLLDGPGRMDHIAWVTMTEAGPRFANIKLEAIYDKHGPSNRHRLKSVIPD